MKTINITCKAHLTPEHQLKAADALISKLRQELAAANAYIEELEETKEKGVNYELQESYKDLQIRYDILDKERRSLAKSANIALNALYQEERFSKLREENSELKKLNKRLTDERDKLIYRLNKKESV